MTEMTLGMTPVSVAFDTPHGREMLAVSLALFVNPREAVAVGVSLPVGFAVFVPVSVRVGGTVGDDVIEPEAVAVLVVDAVRVGSAVAVPVIVRVAAAEPLAVEDDVAVAVVVVVATGETILVVQGDKVCAGDVLPETLSGAVAVPVADALRLAVSEALRVTVCVSDSVGEAERDGVSTSVFVIE